MAGQGPAALDEGRVSLLMEHMVAAKEQLRAQRLLREDNLGAKRPSEMRCTAAWRGAPATRCGRVDDPACIVMGVAQARKS
jgi:hypothetical protein